jgi:hypothetical protein
VVGSENGSALKGLAGAPERLLSVPSAALSVSLGFWFSGSVKEYASRLPGAG